MTVTMTGQGPTAHDLAVLYRGVGLHLFPLCPASKTPAAKWGGFHLLPSTEPSCWQEHPDHGIGIATGPASGCWVLDIDTSVEKGGGVSLRRLLDEHGPLPRTPMVRTGSNGLHIYFRWPTDVEVRNSTNRVGRGIDVRGIGGYAYAPSPSPHPKTGRFYTWVVTPWEAAYAEAPAWLLKLTQKPLPPPAPAVVFRIWHEGDGRGPLERARRYAEKAPPSIEGAGGRDAIFKVAAVCIKALALSEAEALEVLRLYNTRAEPPWAEDELRERLASARDTSSIPLGCWL